MYALEKGWIKLTSVVLRGRCAGYLSITVDADKSISQQHQYVRAEGLTLHHLRPLLLCVVDGHLQGENRAHVQRWI